MKNFENIDQARAFCIADACENRACRFNYEDNTLSIKRVESHDVIVGAIYKQLISQKVNGFLTGSIC